MAEFPIALGPVIQGRAVRPPTFQYLPVLTATVTNPTLGAGGELAGSYQQDGHTVFGRLNLIFGTGMNQGSGLFLFSLPVPPLQTGFVLGAAWLWDASNTRSEVAVARLSGDKVLLNYTGSANFEASSGKPWNWAVGDIIGFAFTYQDALE